MMLVAEQVYNELMRIKTGLEKYEKKKRGKVAAMKVFMPVRDEEGLYSSINNQFFFLVSQMMGRMIVCNTVYNPGTEYPYEFLTTKEFKKYQTTDEWLDAK